MVEEWRIVEDYPAYEVSNLGRVRHAKFKVIRKLSINRGYLTVCVYKKPKRAMPKVHRLVAKAFIINPENKNTVNHKDGNKTNNTVENLEWCSHQENMKHGYKNDLMLNRAENCNFAKLTNEQVIMIRDRYEKYKPSIAQLSKEYGVTLSTMRRIVKRESWKSI